LFVHVCPVEGVTLACCYKQAIAAKSKRQQLQKANDNCKKQTTAAKSKRQ